MATATVVMAATSRAPIPAAFSATGDLRRGEQPGWRRGASGRRLRAAVPARRPFVFSPRAVSDSKSSQTCLDPDASTSVLGIILGGGAGSRLYPLTKKRAKPAVPLGANYRLIDIPVSNCLNSNVSKIYVLTQFNSASLNRHLSRAYGNNIAGYKNEGFVEVLAAQQSPENPNWFQGTADAVRSICGSLRSTMLWNILFWLEITYIVDTTILGLDPERAKELPYIASMGIYVFSKDVMLQLLREKFPSANDFGSEVIPGATEVGMRVQAYLYDGYWEDIGTIQAFYNANLGITKKPVPDFSFYDRSAPIYTQPRYLPPSKVLEADVTDSVIGEGAVIEDSLLMGADYYETENDKKVLSETGGIPIGIGKNAHIRKAIIDKNARIGENVQIINFHNVQEAVRETEGYFIKSGIVTVIKDAVIPSGTVI
ncbi:hypothetical protein PR202_gb22900 [Eleusine coracana subsp. coracana]|uniref:glucose-1-phosphate adenylyltransferase n=1 Tax=Eleusine coracana subsp. coracana TaxID=191504 RepID=A0AAV5FHT2_ELECO|nr:hypothetical protein PR202_gb22900 [Eleusine coracana subsp. coracana]